MDLPVPSTRTICVCSCLWVLVRRFALVNCSGAAVLRSLQTLFSNLHGLAVAEVCGRLGHQRVANGDAGNHFGVRAAIAAKRNGATLGLVVLYKENDVLAIFVTDGTFGNENGGYRRPGFLFCFGTQEG